MANKKLSLLISNLRITSINEETIKLATSNNKVKDFEDGMEYYSAISSGCQCIITEDVKDFYFSEIEVLQSEQFAVKYMMQTG